MNRRLFLPASSSSLATALFLLLTSAPAVAQDGALLEQGYHSPPDRIREALLAPWQLNVELEDIGPAGRYFVIEESDSRMPALADFAKKHYILGGVQIDPAANRDRDFNTDSPDGFRLLSWEDGREVEMRTPEGATVSDATWSPDGSQIAFFAHFDDATYIYTGDPQSGQTSRVTDRPVLATLVTGLSWSGDGSQIFTVLIPEGRGSEPTKPAVAQTPGIWMTTDEENELRTFPSLLETPYDFALLQYYTTGQLARINAATGEVQEIGEPAMIDDVDPSPDGQYVRVTTIREPFSDIVPVGDFATVEEIWDADGNLLAEIASEQIDDAGEEDDDDSARRQIAWLPAGQGLSFVQQEPGAADVASDEQEEEDEDAEGQRDRVMHWSAPFQAGAARVVHTAEHDISDVAYSADGGTLFVTERDGDEEHLYAVSLDGSGTTHTIYEYDSDDFYANPGELMTMQGPAGVQVVRTSPDGRSVYLEGTEYHEDPLVNAPQPFVDRVDISSGEKTRIFQSAPDRYEQVAAVVSDDFSQVVISRESPTEVPNYFLHNLAGGQERQLTENRNYAPDLTSNAVHHVIEAERADGVTFMVSITLPAGYQPGTRLPAMFWHYPSEYDSEKSYDEGNRNFNRNRFPRIGPRSMEHLLLRGWAVVEPDIPIIGPSRDRWNDYYVVDLRNSFSAAIDALDERGWIDRSRLAVGGHSYGGFGTINAMIHTPFFKAGIAGASNTNRALTPSGFQREPRTLWEARETYVRMSPMFWLNEISGALLMYHDQEDQNVGTFPVNSWRAFHGLNALGKEAALYTYPYEAHGPRAEETVLDLWSRWIAWLDTNVLEQ
ncbi:MAG TPA: prolyl oligopeptidase family serine peptidase [Longimicrobiaceae bacterium]|nr:prolyl oligopeptidase family serine peptidase [Longimicrobiaceae bacterium]